MRDFEESFAGLEDTHSEHSTPHSPRRISVTKISMSQVREVEQAMSANHDDYLNSLDTPNGHVMSRAIGRDETADSFSKEMESVTNRYILLPKHHQKSCGPPKHGK